MTRFWHYNKYEEIKSDLSNNLIRINLDQTRILLVERSRWDLTTLKAELLALTKSKQWNNEAARSRTLLTAVAPLLSKPCEKTLEQTIDALMESRDKWGIQTLAGEHNKAWEGARPWVPRDKTRITHLLIALWKSGALAFPCQQMFEFRDTRLTLNFDWQNKLRERLEKTGRRQSQISDSISELDKLLLSKTPIVCIGDVVPAVVNATAVDTKGRIRPVFIAIEAELRDVYGTRAPTKEQYLPNKTSLQDDLNFVWALDLDPELHTWQELSAKWLSLQKTGLYQKQQSLRVLIQCIHANSSLPRCPRAMFTQESGEILRDALNGKNANQRNPIVDFLDWVLSKVCSVRHDDGSLVIDKQAINPLTKQRGFRPTETVNDIMPLWLLRMVLDYLTRDDWKWAKTAVGDPTKRSKGDWFFRSSSTGVGTWIWWPGRAVCLYTKLSFPSRQAQTRHLDSGEADAFISKFDASADDRNCWTMIPNPKPVPSGLKPERLTRHEMRSLSMRRRGAIQVLEGTKQNQPQLRFSTNKTGDRGKEPSSRGYTSSWVSTDVACMLMRLRDWQTENNPISETTPWTEVDEFRSGNGRQHENALRGMDSTFLFRDPASENASHPLTDAKLLTLYKALCLAVEKDCSAIGLTSPDGQPITLITSYDKKGNISGLAYPLHALRASIVTHLIEDGCVNPETVRKIVGHATVKMVLYYVKRDEEQIADIMTRADIRVQEKAKRMWLSEARDRELDDLRRTAFAVNDAGYMSFRSAPSGSILPVNVGVCPNGGSRCQEGGCRLGSRMNEELYAPVPGARANCAGCRFILSGEPWYEGIVSEFNIRSFELSLKNKHLARLDEQLLPIEDDQSRCLREKRRFEQHDRWQALTKEKEEIEAAQEQLHLEMVNLFVLGEQIRHIAADRENAGLTRPAFVAGEIESVELSLSESTEFDLVDRICRSVDIYPGLAARGTTVAVATLFRARAWDRVLRKNGLEPRFWDLTPEQARRVANRATEWLDLRVGRSETLALMDGSVEIAQICQRTGLLSDDFLSELELAIETESPRRLLAQGKMLLIGDDEQETPILATGDDNA